MLQPPAAPHSPLRTRQFRPHGIPHQVGVPLHGQNGEPQRGGRRDVQVPAPVLQTLRKKHQTRTGKTAAKTQAARKQPPRNKGLPVFRCNILAGKQDQPCAGAGDYKGEVFGFGGR